MARILFIAAGGRVMLLLSLGPRKCRVAAEWPRGWAIFGDVCKADGQKVAPVFSGKDPLPLEQADLQSTPIHLHFEEIELMITYTVIPVLSIFMPRLASKVGF